MGGPGEQEIGGVAVDAAGNIAVAGTYSGGADFGDGPLPVPAAGEARTFVALLDEWGRTLWSHGFPGLGTNHSPLVAFDPEGDVVVAGTFSTSAVDFGLGPLPRAGTDDVFVAKLDPSGRPLWSKRFGGPDFQEATGLAVDAAGDIVVAGAFVDTGPDFGLGPLPCAGGSDAFVAKLDPRGDPVWSRSFGGPGSDGASAVGLDGEGNVVVAGMFTQAIDFGRGPLRGAGVYDLFVAKLDRHGAGTWARRFASDEKEGVWAMAVNPAGAVAFTGWDPGMGANRGAYLTALDPAGRVVWAMRRKSYFKEPPVLDGAGNLFVISTAAWNAPLSVTAYSNAGEPRHRDVFGRLVYAHLEAALDRRSSTIIVAGSGSGDTIDLGTGPLPGSDGQLFIIALTR
jgi:hypothetical protein